MMTNLHTNIFSNTTFELLKSIQVNQSFTDFYLAGGTALALYLGHRKSYDLDFFTDQEFNANLINKFTINYQVINLHNNSIEISAMDTKIMFWYFAFPLYKKFKEIQGLRLADPIDIGLMKLLALQGRTTKKDIVDLYFIDQEVIKLEKLLKIFEEFYPKSSFNSYSSLKQLLNIDEIEASPDPIMFKGFKWEPAWKLVSTKIKRHITSMLNL